MRFGKQTHTACLTQPNPIRPNLTMILIFETRCTFLNLLLLLLQIKSIDSKVFFFGLLFPWEGFAEVGSHSAGAVSIAVEEINNDTVTFPMFHEGGHCINFTWADTECDASIGLPLIIDMYFGRNFIPVDFFIGPGCSVICEPGGHLVTDWQVPMVSWGSTSSAMSDKGLYPTFARTIAPNARSAIFFTEVLLHFEYKRVAIFYSSDNVWSLTAVDLREAFWRADIDVIIFHMFEAGENGKNKEYLELQSASSQSRGRFNI